MCSSDLLHAAPPAPAAVAAPAPSTATSSEPASNNGYVVKKGDTVMSLVRTTYKGSPLRLEVLRDALLAANPELAKAKSQALRPGTRLVLPEHGEIVFNAMAAFVSPQDLARLLPPPEGNDPAARRDWIRFP